MEQHIGHDKRLRPCAKKSRIEPQRPHGERVVIERHHLRGECLETGRRGVQHERVFVDVHMVIPRHKLVAECSAECRQHGHEQAAEREREPIFCEPGLGGRSGGFGWFWVWVGVFFLGHGKTGRCYWSVFGGRLEMSQADFFRKDSDDLEYSGRAGFLFCRRFCVSGLFEAGQTHSNWTARPPCLEILPCPLEIGHQKARATPKIRNGSFFSTKV
jgi:hypothetical protein